MGQDMNERNKSKALIKMVGWKLDKFHDALGSYPVLVDEDDKYLADACFGRGMGYPNLYLDEHTDLAWGIVNWRAKNSFFDNEKTEAQAKVEFNKLFLNSQSVPLREARKLWLDWIFTTGIEAGFIDPTA